MGQFMDNIEVQAFYITINAHKTYYDRPCKRIIWLSDMIMTWKRGFLREPYGESTGPIIVWPTSALTPGDT